MKKSVFARTFLLLIWISVIVLIGKWMLYDSFTNLRPTFGSMIALPFILLLKGIVIWLFTVLLMFLNAIIFTNNFKK